MKNIKRLKTHYRKFYLTETFLKMIPPITFVLCFDLMISNYQMLRHSNLEKNKLLLIFIYLQPDYGDL